MDYQDIPAHLTDEQKGEFLYFAMRHAKRRWRRFMKKPVRRVRRRIRRVFHAKGRGKGKGGMRRRRLHGRGIATFIASLTNDEHDEIFYGGKGKSRGRRTTGKGKRRKLNPIGKDGRRMLCNTCGSPKHFASQCSKGKGKGSDDVIAHFGSNDSEYVDF